jgi:NAD(P)-dependent dehydrogenase (short-subunit alcohol dehydrogenase family)
VQLEGISAVVTGGSSGLGLATTQGLLAAGARVLIVDMREPAESLGDDVLFAAADVTDETAVAAALDAAVAEHGPLRAVATGYASSTAMANHRPWTHSPR